MTESEWLACDDPVAMLQAVTPHVSSTGHRLLFGSTGLRPVSPRRLRLFACACWRHLWTKPEEQAEAAAVELWLETGGDRPARLDHWVNQPDAAGAASDAAQSMWPNDARRGAALLREIAGNPFADLGLMARDGRLYRRVSRTPERHAVREEWALCLWLTPDVLAVARAAYDLRLDDGTLDPDRLAILSDAAEEAGCSDAAILGHLRSAGPHVRGCWALDLVLGLG